MPDVVRPGEKVFVVVDGVAYEIVNDDGSDIGSASDDQVFAGKCADGQLSQSKCDETVSSSPGTVSSSNSHASVTRPLHHDGPTVSASSPKEPSVRPGDSKHRSSGTNNRMSVSTFSGLPSKNGHTDLSMSPKEPDLQPDVSKQLSLSSDSGVLNSSTALSNSKHMSISSDSGVMNCSSAVSSDSDGISSVNDAQSSGVAGESTVPRPRTVLADDDEFKHLTAEFGNSLMPINTRPSGGTKPKTFTKPSPGIVARLPVRLPKITFQAPPQIRLISTANTATTVAPLSVVSSCTLVTSPPRQRTVTTVIRSSSSAKDTSGQPPMSPAKSPKKKKVSLEKDVESAAAFKRTRQPRISKRSVILSLS